MNSNMRMACPNCGNETFKTATQPNCLADFYGATCERCGRTITQDDVNTHFSNVAKDEISRGLSAALGDAFKKR